jgi:hypothetical protein
MAEVVTTWVLDTSTAEQQLIAWQARVAEAAAAIQGAMNLAPTVDGEALSESLAQAVSTAQAEASSNPIKIPLVADDLTGLAGYGAGKFGNRDEGFVGGSDSGSANEFKSGIATFASAATQLVGVIAIYRELREGIAAVVDSWKFNSAVDALSANSSLAQLKKAAAEGEQESAMQKFGYLLKETPRTAFFEQVFGLKYNNRPADPIQDTTATLEATISQREQMIQTKKNAELLAEMNESLQAAHTPQEANEVAKESRKLAQHLRDLDSEYGSVTDTHANQKMIARLNDMNDMADARVRGMESVTVVEEDLKFQMVKVKSALEDWYERVRDAGMGEAAAEKREKVEEQTRLFLGAGDWTENGKNLTPSQQLQNLGNQLGSFWDKISHGVGEVLKRGQRDAITIQTEQWAAKKAELDRSKVTVGFSDPMETWRRLNEAGNKSADKMFDAAQKLWEAATKLSTIGTI